MIFFRSSRLSISFVITGHQKALLFFRGVACSERKVPHAAAMSEEKLLPFAGYVFERFRVLFASRSLDFFSCFGRQIWRFSSSLVFRSRNFSVFVGTAYRTETVKLTRQSSIDLCRVFWWSFASFHWRFYLALLVRSSWLVPLYLEIFSAFRLGPVFLQRLPL